MPGPRAVVELTSGRVRGRDEATFLGIPYAAPPVGERRWRPPAPVQRWAGERDATRCGPPPPQPQRPISRFAWGELPPGAEDCLYLNVWRPRDADDGPWPVLVWVIGGGFAIGWTGSGVDDGATLADAARAVVVTFSYRLGSLGWAFGNWGLLDQVAVLEWVRREIAAFGGDPARVTLGGQSAGAACVANLLVSPAAEGLFAQAILHSPPLPEAAGDPERRARWDAALGLDRTARAEAVVARHDALLAEPEWRGTRGGALPARDEVLPAGPLESPGARPDVPVIVGTARDEATFLLRTGGREASDEEVRALTARLFAEPAARWAAERAAAGARVHRFRIEHPSHDPRLGALHTIDVPLLFGTFATSEVARHYVRDTPATRAASADMRERWARFLHGGEPWPAGEEHVVQ